MDCFEYAILEFYEGGKERIDSIERTSYYKLYARVITFDVPQPDQPPKRGTIIDLHARVKQFPRSEPISDRSLEIIRANTPEKIEDSKDPFYQLHPGVIASLVGPHLAELGAKGWELVTIQSSTEVPFALYHLKRRLEAKQ